uniref:Putative secreted protein n=1 Tax=Ixodes ricinus TaxID=34613 RepID=A0A6B0UIV7_IXORI
MFLKKACFLTSSASFSLVPSRLSGFFLSNLLMMAMASMDRNRGYLTSSCTMLSNTSSSSSPGKGDSPTSISKSSTPRPHQSTARVYEVSVSTSGARNSGVPQKVPVRSP